mmetsp:Transcript_15645/g.18554  ORF Transcript_15645/g.18554 Transcript_15645/m.18554 type:complete len:86 (-) Transcript_15645:252-509(-)
MVTISDNSIHKYKYPPTNIMVFNSPISVANGELNKINNLKSQHWVNKSILGETSSEIINEEEINDAKDNSLDPKISNTRLTIMSR